MKPESDNDTGTDTNFGWWIDKPERADRRPVERRRSSISSAGRSNQVFIWRNALLIVALMVAFAWSLKSIAGW